VLPQATVVPGGSVDVGSVVVVAGRGSVEVAGVDEVMLGWALWSSLWMVGSWTG